MRGNAVTSGPPRLLVEREIGEQAHRCDAVAAVTEREREVELGRARAAGPDVLRAARARSVLEPRDATAASAFAAAAGFLVVAGFWVAGFLVAGFLVAGFFGMCACVSTVASWHHRAVPREERDADRREAPREAPRADRGTISDTGAGDPAVAQTISDTGASERTARAADLTGTMIGRYRVLGRLGAGAMGVVYAAHDPALDRKVALKVLPPIVGTDTAHVEARARLEARLRREAQALAKLEHANVVGVYEVGITAETVFVAMQLVDGTTLEDHLAAAKPSVRQIVALFVAAGRGLAAAHAAGLVHRDVKPANILVDRAGRAYIGDFGLARGSEDIDPAGATQPHGMLHEQMTRAGAVVGTPRYMSPEQHAGEPATARSDQYSFCIALWSALFDEHPFAGATTWTTGVAVPAMVANQIRRPLKARRRVPGRVTRALVRGMRFDEAARWPSMGALLDAIEPRSRRAWVFGSAAVLAVAGAVISTTMLARAPDRKAACATSADAILLARVAGTPRRARREVRRQPRAAGARRLRGPLAAPARGDVPRPKAPRTRARCSVSMPDLRIFRETVDEARHLSSPRTRSPAPTTSSSMRSSRRCRTSRTARRWRRPRCRRSPSTPSRGSPTCGRGSRAAIASGPARISRTRTRSSRRR